MYESNTASDLNGSGQNVADITQKQLAAIKAASNAGQLNNAKFSVVIVGYSWGGDKAISAAMELYEALKAEGLEDKVDIHLVTMDAVERGKATPTPIKTPSYPKSIFASWHNYYETADAFTPGQAYPGAAADKEVTALHPVLPNILAAGRTVETDLGL